MTSLCACDGKCSFLYCVMLQDIWGLWIPCESKKDKEIVDMTFAENLKMLRKQAGMSQEQLAEKLGVSRQAVTKWETGVSQTKRY